MDLPSPRELELETALRQRNVQVAQLSDEITRLRAYVSSSSSSAATTEHTDATTVTIPPQLMALLLPHIQPEAGPGSSSVTSALTQRVKGLQEENDELYDILKQGETGRLKEEVRSLRRVVRKLEDALGESHKIVVSLSTELDKAYEALKPQHHSPRNATSVNNAYHRNGTASPTQSKQPPTGPRAHTHKKPRVSEPRRREESRGRSGHHRSGSKMDVDDDRRDRDDRDGNRSRRSVHVNQSTGGSSGGHGHGHHRGGSGGRRTGSSDRTLAERMGVPTRF
ncbi:hypothetical protein DFS33DRAFT_584704 [Desarmillaria ectypa]|nr:hypothetical protein DFS33DRAFT_584704 [Desarmillaria ectypa]